MRWVFLGAPGSGKGTQSKKLVAKYGIPQVSSGDLLRAALAAGTELGLKAKSAMDAGRLVPDAIVLELIRERLQQRDATDGFILDGYPRNLSQARTLDRLLDELGQPLDAVVLMKVEHDVLIKRLTGRRSCLDCGRLFNIYFAPPGSGEHCTRCDDMPRLYQRPDDNERTIAERLAVYRSETEPLVDYYRKRNLLHEVDAEGDIDEILARIEQTLGLQDR